jgi:hypothetical protein
MPRQDERVTYYTETTLECSSGKRDVRISDLSRGGCYIDSIATVQEGEIVSFDIVVPPGVRLKFQGEVAYIVSGMGFGVRFVSMNDEKQDFVDGIIKSLDGS